MAASVTCPGTVVAIVVGWLLWWGKTQASKQHT